ncbi:MAG: glycoside hydrolase family 13 protein [Anaeromyxobacter sp.]
MSNRASRLDGWALACVALAASGLLACNGSKKKTEEPVDPDACVTSPYGDTALFLRGTMNSWAAPDDQKFTYVCNHYELVTQLDGSHDFKIADADWSAGTNFGGPGPVALDTDLPLVGAGANLSYAFAGEYRFVLDPRASATAPTLRLQVCPAAPLAVPVYMKGEMNGWAASPEYQFAYSCDAYYVNFSATGTLGFKVADANWSAPTTWGSPTGASNVLASGVPYALVSDEAQGSSAGNLSFAFTGDHTAKLAFDAEGSATLTIGPQEAGHGVQEPTDPIALAVRFDSRQLKHKTPFGAVTGGTPGTTVTFALEAPAGVESATLVLEKRTLEGNQNTSYAAYQQVELSKAAGVDGAPDTWSASYAFTDVDVYGYYFRLTIGGTSYVYGNNADQVYWTSERGSAGLGQITFVPANPSAIRRYRLTVYAPDFTVPAWAQDAVYYYIFPERFRNGDPSNDPRENADLYQGVPVEFHEAWTENPYLPGDGHSDSTYNNDFFGGDLQGVIDELPYIKSLGANTIYMTPIFQAVSNHKYDHGDFSVVDPHFGDNALFAQLTQQAAAQGIRVILDASFDHTGSDSLYFNRYGEWSMPQGVVGAYQGGTIHPESPFYDWFTFNDDGSYLNWGGPDMPRIDTTKQSFKDYTLYDDGAIALAWLDRGAAGWRMDVAPWVTDEYWREFRTVTKGHDPESLAIAETWFDSSKFFLGDEFDTTMNYIFKDVATAYANGGDLQEIYANIELMRENYPPQAFYALMNLISSHDVPRILFQFGDTGPSAGAAAIAEAKKRMVLATLFQVTMPGAPAIYYGDEVGVTGGADPYNRATYPWADEGGAPDTTLLETVKALVKVRNDHPILRRGSFAAPAYLDASVLVHVRQLGDQWAVTALNSAATARTVTIDLPAGAAGVTFTDALGGAGATASGGQLTITVPAQYGTVLLAE